MKTIAFALSLVFALASPTLAAPRPNILYLYVDDMGWGSIGPNGQAKRKATKQPSVLTPNLDRLAANGVNFTRGYGCTVCSPARSSQQSGYHQGHTWGDRNDPNNAKKAMRADEILMGDALSAAGYATGYWGKWGYGGSKDMQGPVIQNIQTLPTTHGYQRVLAELHHVRAHTFFQPTLWKAPAKPGAKGGMALAKNSVTDFINKPGIPNTPAYQDHPDYPSTAYCDDAYAFAALEFVRRQATEYHKTGKPFFALFAAQIPHAPFDEISKLPNWSKAYENDPHFAKLPKQAQQWAAMVTRIDAHFGNILAALEDPNGDGNPADSVTANTLVIFQSDNGGPGGTSNGAFDANGGLRGNKGSIYEGGIRVPTVMSWPEQINGGSNLEAGTNSNMVIDVTDLLPTFCELAGTEIPCGLDGVSLAPTLLGTGHQRPREFLIHEAGGLASIIRGNDKLVISRNKSNSTKEKKKPRKATPKLALYDLAADPGEENDLAAQKPELVKELHALLLAERVTEPDDFANTYHHWTGKGATESASDPANWSDYTYANDGIEYLTDIGAPRSSWTAKIESKSRKSTSAIADADLEFLSLELRGAYEGTRQHLMLGEGVRVTGRNEIRIGAHSMLSLNSSTASSQRWIDIRPEGELTGHGTVDADLYNSGKMVVNGVLKTTRDYRESPDASILIAISDIDSNISIAGEATLAGELAIAVKPGTKRPKGHTFTALKANKITGRFSNPNNEVRTFQGVVIYKITYSDTKVTLTAM